MRIALCGASGRIGQYIPREALVRGHEVKALVCHPQSLKASQAEQVWEWAKVLPLMEYEY
jgi:putative NADH-flavin reductase